MVMNDILYDLQVWLVFILLIAPLVVFALAGAAGGRFCRATHVSSTEKRLYFGGVVLGSFGTVAYLCYWGVWLSSLYSLPAPFWTRIVLGWLMHAGRFLCAGSVFCLAMARGPYRGLLALAVVSVAIQLFLHAM